MKRDFSHEFGDDDAEDEDDRVHPRFAPVIVNGVRYAYKNAERYRALRAAALCVICGKVSTAESGRAYCEPCGVITRARARRNYQTRKMQGKCAVCGAKPVPGRTLCSDCYTPKRKPK